MIFNTLVVWLFTGIWHGSTLNFVIWGLFLFVLIMIEKLLIGKYLNQMYVLPHVYMFFAIVFSWMIFAIPNLSELGVYITRLFGFSSGIVSPAVDFLPQLKTYWLFLLLGLIFCTPLPAKLWEKIRSQYWVAIPLLLLFWLCVYRMSIGLNDPFMYFSF